MPRMREDSMTVREWTDKPRELPWGATLSHYPADGGPRRKTTTFHATKAEADAIKSAFDAAPKTKMAAAAPTSKTPIGDLSPKSSTADYLDAWLREVIEGKKDDATYRSYEQLVRLYIKPQIGKVKIGDLRRAKILSMYNALKADGVKLGTRKHVHSCLSSALGTAASFDIIEHNFCEGLGRQLRHTDEAGTDPEPNPFTATEWDAFVAHVRKYERPWFEYFTFLGDTGVRVGEAAALKWTCIDPKAKTASIEKSFSPSKAQRAKRGKATTGDKDPKTHQVRTIDLTTDFVALLPKYRKAQREKLMAIGRPSVEYVFTTRSGSAKRQDGNMRRVFARVLAELADPKWTKAQRAEWFAHTPHSIRDTFATIHLMQDWNKLPWVSQQLGHAHTMTTERHYFKYKASAQTKTYADQIRTRKGGAK